MHIEQVRFDRIFDVQQRTGDFSFESGGWPAYGVNAIGGKIPREASAYAVAFSERGNWETVIGWRDMATQEVQIKRTSVGPHLPWNYGLVSLLLTIAMNGGGWKAALPVAAILALIAVLIVRHGIARQRLAEQGLRGVRQASVGEGK